MDSIRRLKINNIHVNQLDIFSASLLARRLQCTARTRRAFPQGADHGQHHAFRFHPRPDVAGRDHPQRGRRPRLRPQAAGGPGAVRGDGLLQRHLLRQRRDAAGDGVDAVCAGRSGLRRPHRDLRPPDRAHEGHAGAVARQPVGARSRGIRRCVSARGRQRPHAAQRRADPAQRSRRPQVAGFAAEASCA